MATGAVLTNLSLPAGTSYNYVIDNIMKKHFLIFMVILILAL